MVSEGGRKELITDRQTSWRTHHGPDAKRAPIRYFPLSNFAILADGTRSRPNPVRLVTVSTIPRAVPNSMAEPLYTSIFSEPLFRSSSVLSWNTPQIVRSIDLTSPCEALILRVIKYVFTSEADRRMTGRDIITVGSSYSSGASSASLYSICSNQKRRRSRAP